MIHTEKLILDSEGGFFSANLTEKVRAAVATAGVSEGQALVYFMHTTGGVVIIEHEAGFVVDLEDLLERILPVSADYAHHMRGYDMNGAAHVRAALLGASVTIPISEGRLLMGTFQDVLVVDMQNDRAPRTVVIQVTGE